VPHSFISETVNKVGEEQEEKLKDLETKNAEDDKIILESIGQI